MRVAIGGFWHETNTFNPLPTTRAAFEAPPGRTWRREAMAEAFAGGQPVLTGFARGLRAERLDAVPTFFAMAGPHTGTIDEEAFEWAADALVAGIRETNPDAVLLHLHGAGASARYLDPESEILRRVRGVVGPNRPIVTVNDAHGNVGRGWSEAVDVAIAYKTIPHLDMVERGEEAATLVARILRREIHPVASIRRPRILLKGGLMSLTETPLALIKPPLHWLSRRAAEMERDERVVNVSINAGFGDADVPEAGLSILVHTDAEPRLADELADELAELAWRLRHGFDPDLVMTPTRVAVARALETDRWPVVLADEGNNTAGGSPGDGTVILAELASYGWQSAALFIRDEIAVGACARLGVGAPIELEVGGRLDPTSGRPCPIAGQVRLLGYDGPIPGDALSDPGRVAVVRCGETDIVLTERSTSQTSAAHFRRFGIEPREKRIVVVQSAAVFRHGFEVAESIARTIIEVDTPGITSPDPRRFDYRHVERPVYPLDELSHWSVASPIREAGEAKRHHRS
jgi:microcystin degradation protein MlrC